MTMSRFRVAAAVLILFNLAGTVLTWAAHLQKSTVGDANAIGGGTQFTGPLVFAAIAIVAFAMTYSSRRWVNRLGVLLPGIWGAGYTIGEISELFQHNVGIGTARWHLVLALTAVGAVIGIVAAVTAGAELASARRASRATGSAAVSGSAPAA